MIIDWMPSGAVLMELDYYARKYDEVNAPLYISYPTLGFWKQTVTPNETMSGIAACKKPFMYFHIPFCENVCHYCMCYKVPAATKEIRRRYISSMIAEIEQKAAYMDASNRIISHLHCGGGTPLCLEADEIELLFDAFERSFTIDTRKERCFSIEAYPRMSEIAGEKLSLLRQYGFNEISFGVQDLDIRVQQAINRSTTFEELAACVETARLQGFRVHLDLCYGLPFQSPATFEETVAKTISLSPDRVAMLTYIHFPVLYGNQRAIPGGALPNSFMRTLLWQCAKTAFTDAGYGMVGIDHFVRTDDPLWASYKKQEVRRDLMGYSVGERKSVLGIGTTAISFVDNSYYHNTMTVAGYCNTVESGQLPLEQHRAYALTQDDVIRSEIILCWLLTYGVLDTDAIGKTFGISFETLFNDERARLAAFERDGMIAWDGGKMAVTERGFWFCRHIAAVFDRHNRS